MFMRQPAQLCKKPQQKQKPETRKAKHADYKHVYEVKPKTHPKNRADGIVQINAKKPRHAVSKKL
jgi:hypothetical protein